MHRPVNEWDADSSSHLPRAISSGEERLFDLLLARRSIAFSSFLHLTFVGLTSSARTAPDSGKIRNSTKVQRNFFRFPDSSATSGTETIRMR